MHLILQSFYFILPAYIANMCPVIFRWIPFGATPLDHGRSFYGDRFFGENKTYRGLISGIFGGILTIYLQVVFYAHFRELSLLPYGDFSILQIIVVGFAFGFGALFGDAIKSFFKRRLDKPDSSMWFPFDQLDFVIGALICVSFFYVPDWKIIAVICLMTPVLHITVNLAAFLLKLKQVWW